MKTVTIATVTTMTTVTIDDNDDSDDSDDKNDSGSASNRTQSETTARGIGTIACGAFSPALLLFGLVGMHLMCSRRSTT